MMKMTIIISLVVIFWFLYFLHECEFCINKESREANEFIFYLECACEGCRNISFSIRVSNIRLLVKLPVPRNPTNLFFVFQLIDLCSVAIFFPSERIVWSYGKYQDAFRHRSDKVEFVEGLPDATLLDSRRILFFTYFFRSFLISFCRYTFFFLALVFISLFTFLLSHFQYFFRFTISSFL